METTAFLPVIWVFLLAFAACATIYLAIDHLLAGSPSKVLNAVVVSLAVDVEAFQSFWT